MLLRKRCCNRITTDGEGRLGLLTDPILDSTKIEINLTFEMKLDKNTKINNL